MDLQEQLDDFDRRIARLERLAYQTYTDTQLLAEYAYLNVRQEVGPDEIKRLPGFQKLQDKEAFGVGLMMHEVAALKQTTRTLRKQVRRDSLTIIRDLMRPKRKSRESEHSTDGSGVGAHPMSNVPG